MTQQFYDLSFEQFEDGTVHLGQCDYAGETATIALHPEQLLFIARQMGGMKPETAERVAELERRIAILTDKLQHFVCNDAIRSDLIDQCGSGSEYLARLDGLLDLALEFDGGRLVTECKATPHT